MQVNRPLPIADFLHTLTQAGEEVVPDSLIWIPDPNKPGRMIAAVQTRPTGEALKPVLSEVEGPVEVEAKPGRWVIEKKIGQGKR